MGPKTILVNKTFGFETNFGSEENFRLEKKIVGLGYVRSGKLDKVIPARLVIA